MEKAYTYIISDKEFDWGKTIIYDPLTMMFVNEDDYIETLIDYLKIKRGDYHVKPTFMFAWKRVERILENGYVEHNKSIYHPFGNLIYYWLLP